MIRAPWGDQAYWDKWTAFDEQTVRQKCEQIKLPSKNPQYRPQYVWDTAKSDIFRFAVRCYSRGDPIRDLGQHIGGLLDAWELSNKLADELNAHLEPGQGWDHRHLLMAPQVSDDARAHTDPRAWIFRLSNLNHYNWCFWLVGLALALEIPEEQWQRLLALIGGEGEDELLDRVIARRQPGRKIGATLLHPKPYARLLKAIDTPLNMQTAMSLETRPYSLNFKHGAKKGRQAAMLRDFVDHWYPELERKGNQQLWWYIYGDPVKHPLEKGSYFGRWCIEAVAAVKAFGLDDSLCLGHEHYPGDLLRPDGPSTHPVRTKDKPGLMARLFGKK